MEKIYDVIIIWAGPSGLFCAIHLPEYLKVLLIEKADIPAQKLLLSAKGRGNLTNLNASAKHYFPENQEIVEKTLHQYGPSDFLSFLKKYEIAYHEEDFGRILLDQKVKPFHEKLLEIAEKQDRTIQFSEECLKITKEADSFKVQTERGEYLAKKVIISTGSPSVPPLWSTSFATKLAQSYSLKYAPFYPALVGLNTEKQLSSLSWSSVVAKGELWSWNHKLYEQKGPILFTHRGISWPVVFNASLYLTEKEKKNLIIFKMKIENHEITKRFLSYLWFRENKLQQYLFTTKIISPRPLEEAKVCGGGIEISELDPSFQSLKIQGLFFIGESVNITGQTWGFNLQRCRSSAFGCAKFFEKGEKNG